MQDLSSAGVAASPSTSRLGAVTGGGRPPRAVERAALGVVSRRVPATELGRGVEVVPGFRLVEKVGEGPSAETWKAEGPGGFPAAFKVFRTHDVPDDLSELPWLAWMRSVRHPHVRPTFGAWRIGGRMVLGMEWAEESLRDRVLRARAEGRPGLSPEELIGVMEEAALGLDAIEAAAPGTAGTDPGCGVNPAIKLENLLFVGGCLKVADYGMAEIPPADHLAGPDLAHTAPEVVAGQRSRWSSQFSLAALYCGLRDGLYPERGGGAESLDGSTVPEAERDVIARALAMPPESRWPDCRAFVSALRRAQAPIPACDPIRSVWRSPRAWIPTSTAGVVLLGALSVWLTRPLAMAPDPASPVRGQLADLPSAPSPVSARGPRAAPIRRPLTSLALITKPSQGPGLHAQSPISFPSGLPDEMRPAPLLSSPIPPFGAIPAGSAELDLSRDDLPEALPEIPDVKASPTPTSARRAASAQVKTTLPLVAAATNPPTASPPGEPKAKVPSPAPTALEPKAVDLAPPPASLAKGPQPATIVVLMPGERWNLSVKGQVGQDATDEWFGPRRVIHTPPLKQKTEYTIGGFWASPTKKVSTRNYKLSVSPGETYEVDLRRPAPSARRVLR